MKVQPEHLGARILVVDDDAGLVDYLVETLAEHGFEARGETDPLRGLERITATEFAVVIADVEMPGMRGPELMAAIHKRKSHQLVILMTAFGSIELAVQTLKAGAVDFLAKPFSAGAVVLAIERAMRERAMNREVIRLQAMLGEIDTGDLVAVSPGMRRAVEIARRAARTRSAVLLTGESGVGKSSLAALIHRASPRAMGPIVTLNCAALPLALAEAELFGARRGAYTGATEDREGLFVRASGGTLFLDEIGELPLALQPKLLEALETGKIRPLGAKVELATDARLVAATNTALEDAVERRSFRPDLFFRLNVIRIEIPPLRDRREDLPRLVDGLVRRACIRAERRVSGISVEALKLLSQYHWPGNVRELANVIERAVVMSEHDCLVADDFVLDSPLLAPSTDFLERAARDGLPLAAIEREYIRRVLDAVGGVKLEAARVLGIDRRTLYRKLEADEEPAG